MFQRWKHSLRPTASIILLFFAWFAIHPWNYAAAVSNPTKQPHAQARRRAVFSPTPHTTSSAEAALAETLTQIETTLAALRTRLHNDTDASREAASLLQLRLSLEQLDTRVRQSFVRLKQHLKANGLPEEILQRHRQMGAIYDTELTTLLHNLDAIAAARNLQDRRTKTEQALQHLQAKQKRRRHRSFDPNNLPFRVPDGKVRKPKERQEDFHTFLFPQQSVRIATADMMPGLLAVAQVVTASAAPSPGDLAPTEDVQITEEIKIFAATLDDNPVKIYNWVHDHIEFLPTYGSIQGSQMTLENKAGNAFDTASLLIALLRAANIPARYVTGTVQIPIEKVMNWVGGVDKPEAALQILGQGGIPSTGLVRGGVIAAVKLEHIWVEAWVDYVPSRGARHREGDTWVPMDASFKQYTYTEGMALLTTVPFDAQSLINQLSTVAQFDETAGWISGMDHALIQNSFTAYLGQLNVYVGSQHDNATIGDVVGTKIINPKSLHMLPASLPYHLIVRGNTFTQLPDNLRHKFRFALYATALDQSFDDPAWSFTDSLASLAGKKITLSFTPASQVDLDLINRFFPELNVDGTPIAPSQLPNTLPGYLIHLVPELKVDGDVVARGQSFRLGTELPTRLSLWSPAKGWIHTDNICIAGEFVAIGLAPQGISERRLQALHERLEATTMTLESVGVSSVGKEEVVGDLLYTTILYYLSLSNIGAQLGSQLAGVVHYTLPSFGFFETVIEPNYLFGIPQTVTFRGLNMDVDLFRSMGAAKDGNHQAWIEYLKGFGLLLSANEHRAPEQLLSTPDHPVEAVSTVKALTAASASGQRIWTIDRTNIAIALPQLTIDEAAKAEIADAVAAGKVATVSETTVTVNAWTGVGYILFDPETGSGAYKISGGTNGAIVVAGTGIGLIGVIAILGVLLVANVVIAHILIALAFSIAAHLIFIGLLSDPDLSWSSISISVYYTAGIVLTVAGAIFKAYVPVIIGIVAIIIATIDRLTNDE